MGIDLKDVPVQRTNELEGLLFELPERVMRAADCPESWVKNVQLVDLWAKEQKYNTHNVNWFKFPDGSMVCSLLDRQKITLPCQDELGRVMFDGKLIPMQQAFDKAYMILCEEFQDSRYIWDLEKAKRWGRAPASEKQLRIIQRRCKGFDVSGLSKLEASQILNRVMGGKAG